MYLLKKLKKEKKCIYFYVKSPIIIRCGAIFPLDPSIITGSVGRIFRNF